MNKKFLLVSGIFLSFSFFNTSISYSKDNANKISKNNIDSIDGIKVKDITGNTVNLSDYKGKVLLIVNVASQCGYTPQYDGLEKIYKKYNKKGFEILGFPCNDFGEQEPGNNEEIQMFCKKNYGVTFKLFDKVKILGDDKHPLYKKLTNFSKKDINWNFEKFLISRKGKIIKAFKSAVRPESKILIESIESELSKI